MTKIDELKKNVDELKKLTLEFQAPKENTAIAELKNIVLDKLVDIDINVYELPEMQDYLKVSEAAAYMRINKRTLEDLIREKQIPVIKVTTKSILIDFKDIQTFLDSKKVLKSAKKEELEDINTKS